MDRLNPDDIGDLSMSQEDNSDDVEASLDA
jgi:hypothetical protein